MPVDLTTYVQQLVDGARDRGLKVLDAATPDVDPVLMVADRVPLADALDLARDVGAPFLEIVERHFSVRDTADAMADKDGGDDALASAKTAMSVFREYDGNTDIVAVRWIGGSFVYEWQAHATWSDDVSAAKSAWVFSRITARVDEGLRRDLRNRERADELASTTEGDPTLRAAPKNRRAATARALIATQLTEDEASGDYDLLDAAVQGTIKLLADNTADVYETIAHNLDEYVPSLLESDAWLRAARVPERDDAAAKFLTTLADGYAPTLMMARNLRVLADRIGPLPEGI